MVTLQFDDTCQVTERTSDSLLVIQFSPLHQAFLEQRVSKCDITAVPSLDSQCV